MSTADLARRSPRWHGAHAAALAVDPNRYLRWRQRRDGDEFFLHLPGTGDVLFTCSPDAVRELFRIDPSVLASPTPNPIEPLVGPGSLVLRSGLEHRRERAALLPQFHGAALRSRYELMADITAQHADRWTVGQVVDLRSASQSITAAVIAHTVLGEPDRQGELIAVMTRLLDSFGAAMMLLPPLRRRIGIGPWDRVLRARVAFDALLDKLIDAGALTELLGDLDGIPRADLRDQVRTLMVAGHETTATSVCWLLHEVHRHSGVLALLRAELDQLDAEDPLALVAAPYLSAVAAETLRLHPPVPVVLRRLLADQTIAGVPLRAQDTVAVATSAIQLDARWYPLPDEFDPNRFVARTAAPGAYVPFGGGHRRCVGAAFATAELAIVSGTLLRLLDWELPARQRYRPTPRSVPRNIATRPSRRLTLRVVGVRRSPSTPADGRRC